MAYQTPFGTQTKTGQRSADRSWLQRCALHVKLFVSRGYLSHFIQLIAFAVILMVTPAYSAQRTPSSLDSQQRGADVPHPAEPRSSLDDDSASDADDAGPRDPHANATQKVSKSCVFAAHGKLASSHKPASVAAQSAALG